MKIYELADELGVTQKDLVTKIRTLGMDVKNHMSKLGPEDIVRVRRAIEKERQAALEVSTIAPTVMRRRTKAAPPLVPPALAASHAAPVEPPAQPAVPGMAPVFAAAREPAAAASPPFPSPAPAPAPAPPAHPERRMIVLPPGSPSAPRYVEVTPGVPRVVITQDIPGRRDVLRRDLISERDRLKKAQQLKKRRIPPGRKGKQTEITTPAEHKRVIRMMGESIAVGEIARQMGIKANEVLKKLWSMGTTGVNINQNVDHDTASLVATEFGYEVKSEAFREEVVLGETVDKAEDLAPRAPVVTIMGHVDHGKTSLLDAIRQANVAGGEAGGITQHIGAYKVSTKSGDVVFVDTPGHEAFTAMRARGTQVTDIVVLVVAADDGVMPQTLEAVEHARAADVPIVVAINKMDKPEANAERIKGQLMEKGLVPENLGGETIYVEVSARTKQGIDKLLENLAVQSEVLELRANPKKPAKGTVLEAKLDRARGPMATVLIEEGTLKVGETIVTGEHIGKVRAMVDDRGRTIAQAGPSTPVEILGLGGVPEAGDSLYAVADERGAKDLIEHRRDSRRNKEMAGTAKVSLENIMERMAEGQMRELRVVLKTDVQGSAEAVSNALSRIGSAEVRVSVISASVGGINETDVNLAKASGAIVIGFHVRPTGKVTALAEQEGVQIRLYDIIYEAIDDVRKAAAGLLAPEKREKIVGRAEVLQIFHISKVGTIAGCRVGEGKIVRSGAVRLIRDDVKVHEGRLSSLKRFKDDAREVEKGYECGLSIEGYNDLKQGDVIESFEIEEIAPTL
ncbi:MAG: translation initiation factor IF-2 [Myxococcota bacterium]